MSSQRDRLSQLDALFLPELLHRFRGPAWIDLCNDSW